MNGHLKVSAMETTRYMLTNVQMYQSILLKKQLIRSTSCGTSSLSNVSVSYGSRLIGADDVEERLVNLERDQARLLETLQQSGFDIPVASSADGELDRSHGIVSRAHKVDASRSRSPRWQDFGSRSEDEQEAVGSHAIEMSYMLTY